MTYRVAPTKDETTELVRGLMSAVGVPQDFLWRYPHHRRERTHVLEGESPSPVSPPSGCCFRTRCPYATEECAQEAPELRKVDGRLVACHRCS